MAPPPVKYFFTAFLAMLGASLISGCVEEPVTRSFALASCQSLRVQGNVVLELRGLVESRAATGEDQPAGSVDVSGPRLVVNGFTMTQGTDRVVMENSSPEVLTVVATCADLRNLELLGNVRAEQREASVLGADIQRLAVYGESQLALGPVHGEQLDLRVSGQGRLIIDRIVTDSLQVLASSDGRVVLRGETSRLQLNVLGHGRVDANALAAQWVEVQLGGDSRVAVHATAHLGGQVSDASELTYEGSPDLSVETTGSALVRQI